MADKTPSIFSVQFTLVTYVGDFSDGRHDLNGVQFHFFLPPQTN